MRWVFSQGTLSLHNPLGGYPLTGWSRSQEVVQNRINLYYLEQHNNFLVADLFASFQRSERVQWVVCRKS